MSLPRGWLGDRVAPHFIYDLRIARANLAEFRTRVGGGAQVFLSLKANPNAHILRRLANDFDGFDVSSEIELRELETLGVDPRRITLSGPGKTDRLLARAVKLGLRAVHLDSGEEFRALQKLGYAGKMTFRHRGLAKASKLGFSTEEIGEWLKAGAVFGGLHAYLGRESFEAAAINELVETLRPLAKQHLRAPDFALYLGLGLPQRSAIPDDPKFWEMPALKSLDFPVHFEGGRYFLMDAGRYAVPVLAVKRRRGERPLVILDGGLQHLNGPLVSPMGARREVKCEAWNGDRKLEGPLTEHQVFGSLCLANDVLHTHLPLPQDLQRGDWLLFDSFGAYNITASAHSFIGQTPAEEWILEDGRMVLASPSQHQPYQLSF